MNNTIHHADHQKLNDFHDPSGIERKLIALMLNGMGSPSLKLRLWDGSTITHHSNSDPATVHLQSRPALWRFLFRPETAIRTDAQEKGIVVDDAARFRQVMEDAGKRLPGELQIVKRMLRIDCDSPSGQHHDS
jgi:hypothetical protein